MKNVLRNIVLEISLLFSIPILMPKYDPLLRILTDTEMSQKKVDGTLYMQKKYLSEVKF